MPFCIHTPIHYHDYARHPIAEGHAQREVEVSMSSTRTSDLSRYILHDSDLRQNGRYGLNYVFSLDPGLSSAIHYQFEGLCRKIVKAGNNGSIPLHHTGRISYTIPDPQLSEIDMPFPPFGNVEELTVNPLSIFGTKETVCNLFQLYQKDFHKLQAWLALAMFRASSQRRSLWKWPTNAIQARPFILRPGWRLEEQEEPEGFDFFDLWGIRERDGRLRLPAQLFILADLLRHGQGLAELLSRQDTDGHPTVVNSTNHTILLDPLNNVIANSILAPFGNLEREVYQLYYDDVTILPVNPITRPATPQYIPSLEPEMAE
ncbi:hypothetical protein M422DRAFT_265486 [Sphaerobolus stellatus SS14]|uniref:Uncharacterized protein n=1 Tax=Sphaerobolus stellatus (strain SS14) TaxID=990650 RepID=A0A0C9TRA3_SPHS4|nr:hypothetical protein M422DRAFT_265486 [Sphaerobolus stellatus SS14]